MLSGTSERTLLVQYQEMMLVNEMETDVGTDCFVCFIGIAMETHAGVIERALIYGMICSILLAIKHYSFIYTK